MSICPCHCLRSCHGPITLYYDLQRFSYGILLWSVEIYYGLIHSIAPYYGLLRLVTFYVCLLWLIVPKATRPRLINI